MNLILPHTSCISWALSFYPLPHILILFSLLFLLIYCLSGHPLSDYIQEFMVQYPIESDYPLHHHLSGIYSLIAKQIVLTRIVIQLVITISISTSLPSTLIITSFPDAPTITSSPLVSIISLN